MTTIYERSHLRDTFNSALHTPETWAKAQAAPTIRSADGKWTIPDFKAIYPATSSTVARTAVCDDYGLEPRLAYQLWTAADYLTDAFIDEMLFEDELPEVALSYLDEVDEHADNIWLSRFTASFLYFTDCFASGTIPYPRCTGEEIALHLLLDCAQSFIEAAACPGALKSPDLEALPPFSCDTADLLTQAREDWFEDQDFLLLYHAELDVQDFLDNIHDYSDIGFLNLHPATWFLPFRP